MPRSLQSSVFSAMSASLSYQATVVEPSFSLQRRYELSKRFECDFCTALSFKYALSSSWRQCAQRAHLAAFHALRRGDGVDDHAAALAGLDRRVVDLLYRRAPGDSGTAPLVPVRLSAGTEPEGAALTLVTLTLALRPL